MLTFERMMRAYEVPQPRWTFKLAPQLTGKAQQAYAALSIDESQDYEALKAAILRRYNINEETYRRQFRSAKLKKEETPRELATRLRDLAKKWGRDCKTLDELLDLIVKEQLLNCLPEDVRVWVRERKPKSSCEAGELAEDFLQARDTQENEGRTNAKKASPPGNCPRCGLVGHWASECPMQRQRRKDGNISNGGKTKNQERGIICKEKGDMAFKCPKTAGLYCDEDDNEPEQQAECTDVYRRGSVNSVAVEDIILDTGAARTLVREDLVPQDDIKDGMVTTVCSW